MCASRQALSHCLPSSRRFASSRLTYAAVRLVWLAMGSTFTWRPRTVDSSLGMSNQFFVRDAMGESVFLEGLPNVRIFLFFARKTTFPAKKPIASASAHRAVHQRTESEKKHNRAPNRVPIREILAARRGVAYSWESGGCAGACGVAVL